MQEDFTPDFYRIDPNQLDKEWLEQPKLYYQYSTKLANCRMLLEQAKAQKEVVVAEIDKSIRLCPSDFDFPESTRLTEGLIEKTIVLQKRYQYANEEVIKAKHSVDIAAAAESTLEHRRTALSKYVDLVLSSWYGTPRATGINNRTMEEREASLVFGADKKRRNPARLNDVNDIEE